MSTSEPLNASAQAGTRKQIERRAVSRALLGGVAALSVAPRPVFARAVAHRAAAPSGAGAYDAFLAGVHSQAVGMGLSSSLVTEALALTQRPNAKVLELDRHQPEFTLTWAQYRAKVLSTGKIDAGKAAYATNRALISQVSARFSVDETPIMGIWGLESYYGKLTGHFNVIDALATLAFDGRRAAFFRSELLKALKILNERGIPPSGMVGSYAGAMGQPQFMPSAYLSYAHSFDGNGPANIWTSVPDVLASIANYLSRCGWLSGEPWGQPVQAPDTLQQADIGRDHKRSLAQWMAVGVRRQDGGRFSHEDVMGAIVRPDGPGGEAFMVYHNFDVIRRYNPSDYYALGVGLMGLMTT